MEAEAERQGKLKWVFCAVGLDAATFVKEILYAWLQINAEILCDIVLPTDTKRERPLQRHTGRYLFLESISAIFKMTHTDGSMYR